MTYNENLDVCPITKETWEKRAEEKSVDCGGQSVYHCLADNEGRKWERCVEKSLIKEGFCPIFTNKGFIDWKPCNISISTCPNIAYFSDEVYKYPDCFGNNSLHNQIGVSNNKANDIDLVTIIGVVIGLVIFAAAILTFGFLYMRRKRMNSETKDEHEESEMLLFDRMSDEIVIKQNVDNGIALLSKDEVRSIVVVGKFGNFVSGTSRVIIKKFQEMRKWNCLECRYTDIPNYIEENTVLYVYGWFGLWNDDLCSRNKSKTACKSLIRLLNETNNVKLILGMRSDFFKKYHQDLDEEVDEQNMSLVHYELYLDSGADIGKNHEFLRYFNDLIKKPCKKSDCACKNLKYEMLRKGKDRVVGMPLKISVIEKYHSLIPNYLQDCDILKAMIDHFTALEKDEKRRQLYEWIVYICLKGKFTPGSFDTNLVEKIGFVIDELSFKLYSNDNNFELCEYIRMRNSDKQKNVQPENAQYVFWHPFIYICVFHFLFLKNPEFVIEYCNVDAILQLVRPERFKTSYFEVAADNRCVALISEKIRQLGKEEEYAHHPLVMIGSAIVQAEALGLGIRMLFKYMTET